MAAVTLHAYALSNVAGWHVGVEVYGKEYYFDGYNDPIRDRTAGFKGVLHCSPGTWAGKTCEVASLGFTEKTEEEVQRILDELKQNEYTEGYSWTSKTAYSLATHNCQDFAQSFCYRLGCQRVPHKYTQFKAALRADPSNLLRDVLGGQGPGSNCVTIRLRDLPSGWGVMVYTYSPQNPLRVWSYWKEWLTSGEKYMSAGQEPHEEFSIAFHDGWRKCLTGDHVCRAGDIFEISYENLWTVAHYRAGEKLYEKQSTQAKRKRCEES